MHPAANLTIIRSQDQHHFWLDVPLILAGAAQQTVQAPIRQEFRRFLDPALHLQLKRSIDATAETLRTLHRTPHHSTANERLRNLGGMLFSLVLPQPLQESLRRLPDNLPLVLTTNDTQLPWDLLHDDRNFLVLQRSVSRRLLGAHAFVPDTNRAIGKPQILFVVNPNDNLTEAAAEAENLANLYSLATVQTTFKLLARHRATRAAMREALSDPSFTIIHYSGHTHHNALRLADGDLSAAEVRSVMKGSPFVFLNGCSSAGEEQEGTEGEDGQTALIGQSTANLAQTFLEGGAIGVVGTIWPIFDSGSRQFSEWFHAAVLDGAPVGEALLRARRQLNVARPNDPLWASYILYGDPNLRIAGLERRERRLVTLLAVRLTGLSQLYADRSLEEAADFEIRILDHLTVIAQRYGGAMGEPQAELFSIRFGLSISYEDAVDRAIHTAFDLLREIDDLQAALTRPGQRVPLPLTVHLGICTGYVIVREVGIAAAPPQMVGDVAERAARIVARTPDRSLWVDPATRRLARFPFAFQPVHHSEGEDDSSPQPIYAVSRGWEGKTEQSAFVGRTAELALLLERWQEAAAGRGQLVELVGEAGIGKSRLVAAFQKANGDDARWMQAACRSYDSSVTYGLLAQVLRSLVGIDEGESRDEADGKLGNLLAEMSPDNQSASTERRREDVALLGQILGYTFPAPTLNTMALDNLLRRRAGLVQGILTWAAASRPLVLALEDLQWIDGGSLSILEQLVTATRRLPILFLCAYRPTWTPPWGVLPYRRQVLLDVLPQAEQKQLLAALLDGAVVPDEWGARILTRTGGNPFFLEEAVRYLQEMDALKAVDGGWVLVKQAALAELPETVESLIRSRLQRIQPQHQPTVERAAVVGESFERAVLAESADEAAKDVLDPALDELMEQTLIDQTGWDWPDTAYVFHHGLIHQTVYAGLFADVRRKLHRLIASVLVKLYGDSEEWLDKIAEHYYRSDDRAQAVIHCLRAGEYTQNRYTGTALLWYDRALERLAGFAAETATADEQERRVTAQQIAAWQVVALRSRADLQNRFGKNGAALGDYEQALELVQREGDSVTAQADLHVRIGRTFDTLGQFDQVQAALDRGLAVLAGHECPEMGKLRVWTGLVHFRQGRLAEGLAACENGIALLNRFDAPADLAQAHNLLGLLHRHLGHREQALAAYSRSLTFYREVEDLLGQTRVRNNRGGLYQDMGRWDEALVDFETGTELAERTGEVWWRAGGPLNQGEIHRRRGNFDRAIALNRIALVIGDEFDLAGIRGLAYMNLGATYLKQGSLGEAEQHLTEAERIFRETEARGDLSELLGYRVELFIAQDNLAEARILAEEALSIANKMNRTTQQGYAHRVLGRLDRIDEKFGDAEDHLQKSLELVAALPYERALTLLEFGHLVAAQTNEDSTRCLSFWQEALGLFDSLGAKTEDEIVRKRITDYGDADVF